MLIMYIINTKKLIIREVKKVMQQWISVQIKLF